MRPVSAIASLLLVSLAAPAAVPEGRPEQAGISTERLRSIRETMDRHIAAHNIQGAVTLVARRGRVVHAEAHGFADAEAKKPMARNTVFRIWSMTKPVIAVATLIMVEEGKVRLNDPVSKFIPAFQGQSVAAEPVRPGASTLHAAPARREITVQDLLTHVSGLASGPLSNAEAAKIKGFYEGALATSIPQLGATPLEFQPGSRWAYSAGAAFDTLGHIVELSSGQPLDQFLATRLFQPLGMHDTTFHPAPALTPRIAATYHRDKGAITRLPANARMLRLYGPNYHGGAGGLYSTADDYATFAQMLLNGGEWNGQRILSPRTVDWMASAFVPDTFPGRAPGRAFGLSVQVITNPVAAGWRVSPGAYGWDGAFGTHFWIDPKEKIVGVLMIQVDNTDRQLDRDFEAAVFQAIID
jgi:CubicO group peptidase (beta-lactamase class C family)